MVPRDALVDRKQVTYWTQMGGQWRVVVHGEQLLAGMGLRGGDMQAVVDMLEGGQLPSGCVIVSDIYMHVFLAMLDTGKAPEGSCCGKRETKRSLCN